MTMFMYFFLILCQSLTVFSQPIVKVEQGKIRGETIRFENEFLNIQKDIDVFLGVPYAEPPVGERRFTAPVAKEPWSEDEVYDATYPRDICVQKVSVESYGFNQSEDCLHLNVYVPNPKPTNASVMVFIHGGGYLGGHGYRFYSGIPLSSVGDVLVVTIHYRLSAFGYLTTGDDASPGNYGMLDQVEALRWVQTNIEAFGGDPSMITIFGESAGSASVSSHMFSPLSTDLFQQAILESGSVFQPNMFHFDLDAQREISFNIGEAVGCPATSTHQLISCMRQVDAQTINDVTSQMVYLPAPCVDNNFLLESPLTSLAKDNYKKCPLIDGFNRDEGTLLILISEFGSQYLNSPRAPVVSKEIFSKELSKFLTFSGFYKNDFIEDSIKQQYVDWAIADDPDADYFDPWKYLTGDVGFSCPATMEIRAHTMSGKNDVYQYFFTHVPSISFFETEFGGPGWMGATHAEELPFVFGYPFLPPDVFEFHEYPEEEMALSHYMMKYWTNFAKTGNPNKESEGSLPYDDERAWQAYTIPELEYKEIAVNLTGGRGLRADECHFWNDYLKQLMTFSADLAETERQWREEFYTWKYTDMDEWRDAFDEYEALVGSWETLSSRDEL